MKLSFYRVGDAIRFEENTTYQSIKGQRAVITKTYANGMDFGTTSVITESGARLDFVWSSENPEVSKIGKGRVITQVEIEEGA